MDRSVPHAVVLGVPVLVGLVIAAADRYLTSGVVLGLLVVVPMLAANLHGPRVTAGHGVLAGAGVILLGATSDVDEPAGLLDAQVVRLTAIALTTVVATWASGYRTARERALTRVRLVAATAQRAILQAVPGAVGPLRLAVRYDSASQEALVGGDMYAVADTPFGVRILVADVRGKGLSAVGTSARVLGAFRERACDDRDPGALLDRLDATVQRCATDDEEFVTAVLVQVDRDGHVQVVSAGHPPPLLLGRGGVTHVPMSGSRVPLGLGAIAGCGTSPQPGRGETLTAPPLRLAPGERLLLYTDGVTEARRPGDGAVLRLPDVVAGLGAADVGEVVDTVRDTLVRWRGGHLDDDVAIVLAEFTGSARPPLPRPTERLSAAGLGQASPAVTRLG
jgi:hypothetical protein